MLAFFPPWPSAELSFYLRYLVHLGSPYWWISFSPTEVLPQEYIPICSILGVFSWLPFRIRRYKAADALFTPNSYFVYKSTKWTMFSTIQWRFQEHYFLVRFNFCCEFQISMGRVEIRIWSLLPNGSSTQKCLFCLSRGPGLTIRIHHFTISL